MIDPYDDKTIDAFDWDFFEIFVQLFLITALDYPHT